MTTHSVPLEVRRPMVLLSSAYLEYIDRYAKMFNFVNLDNANPPLTFWSKL